MSAATATQRPRITKLKNLMNAGFNPFKRDELSLMPTACVYNPRFVNFITSAITMTHANAIKNGVGIGIPGINPPKYPKEGSLITGSSLLLIHAAIERPAVYRINVATIGCILNPATNIPLNAPKSIATTQLTRNATIIGACN